LDTQADTLELFECDIFLNASTPSSTTSGQQLGEEISDDNTPTPKPGLPSLPPSQESLITKESTSAKSNSDATSSEATTGAGAMAKLEKLQSQSQRKQRELLQMLRSTPLTRLNDVRRKFKTEAGQSRRMVEAWLDKYFKPLNLASGQHLMHIHLQLPDWWDSNCHAVPGSRYLVKDGDWGTMIASTLG
jgi:1-phosphatidylinositol-3-phosphate 5-kinase